jgi:hypothetical protein
MRKSDSVSSHFPPPPHPTFPPLCSQASIQTFLRKHVAGLDMPTGATAWSQVVVRPYAALPLAADVAAAVPFARAAVSAYRGTVEVSWARLAGGGVQLNATLPSGTEGSVSVPKVAAGGGAGTVCTEGGVTVWSGGAFVPGVPGVLAGADDGAFVTFTVTSGAFVFASAGA